MNNIGINLDEIDPYDGKRKYYIRQRVKNGIFRLKYGVYGKPDAPDQDCALVEVDMLTKEITMMNLETGKNS